MNMTLNCIEHNRYQKYLQLLHVSYQPTQSPTSPGAVSPGGGSVSPATGGLSPASGSPVGATVPLASTMHHPHEHPALYDAQVCFVLFRLQTSRYLYYTFIRCIHDKSISFFISDVQK